MTRETAVNWIINLSADLGKAEHRDLWHYEQALSEIREMLESAQTEILACGEGELNIPDTNVGDTISRQAAIDAICNDYCCGHMGCKYYPKCPQLSSVQSLPSAQPEKCEDCRNFNKTMLLIPQPERRGRWIPQDFNKRENGKTTLVWYAPKCSECGYPGNYPATWNYCPNCGARMENAV